MIFQGRLENPVISVGGRVFYFLAFQEGMLTAFRHNRRRSLTERLSAPFPARLVLAARITKE